MRWKRREIRKDIQPHSRVRVSFLLLPKCIGDEWRWFEKTAWIEYYTYWRDVNLGIWRRGYKPDRWIDLSAVPEWLLSLSRTGFDEEQVRLHKAAPVKVG